MKLLPTLTLNPQTLFAKLHFLRHISSNTKQQWNTSTTNLPITNPTLLIMESCKTMTQLKQIQAHMTRTGLFFDTFPVSRLLTFCAISDNGDIRYAASIFSQIQRPNTYIWNVLIKGYCKTSNPYLGLSLFRRMVRNEVDMDERSFVYALKACEGVSNDVMGSLVHCLILKIGVVFDLVVCNGLIHFYADFGCVSFARKVFDEMCVKDVVSWTSMIDGYAKKNLFDEAMGLFDLMLVSDVEPNEVTMIAVLSACCKKGVLKIGKSTHEFMIKNDLNHGINLLNALLDMYVNCGCLISAREIFDKMKVKDVYSWTSMVNGYAKFGEVDHARSMFDLMPHKNVVSWNAMIAGYAQNNQPMKALELFNKMVMEGGIVPIESTLVSVLSACAQSGCLDVGQWIHHFYVNQNRIRLSVILANALIDMYSKCGSIEAAAEIFHTMPERDLVSWNSMIVGYASHGYAQKSLNLFEQMINSKKNKPDDITFIGVLSACSHSGLVSEGKEYFKNMKLIFGLDPKIEHYACMIDLLGRNGLLQEAFNLLTNMTMEPDKAAWGALLNACKVSGNVELGMLVAKKLMILDPKDSGIYALLANICSKSKLWDEVKMVRNMMREREIKKTPGCSAIEVDGEFHEFLVADESHHRSGEIYEVLKNLYNNGVHFS